MTDNEKDNTIYPEPSLQGVKDFLASSYIKGIGEVFAARLVDALGTSAPQLILADPSVLSDIPSLNDSKKEQLLESLKALPQPIGLLTFLFSTGISMSDIRKILSHYGALSPKVVLYDPYQMVEDVWKFSFFQADKIGKYLGIAADDPRRLRGALLTSVKIFAEHGDMFSTETEIVDLASRITGADPDKLRKEIDYLVNSQLLVKSHGGIYLPVYFNAEKEAAERIARLVNNNEKMDVQLPESLVDRFGNRLNHEQIKAIRTVLDNSVTVITGAPGTGKTTAIKGLMDLLQSVDRNIVLVAPTGRAAKRMTELTGVIAGTIHRLLGHRPGDRYRNKEIDVDILIIDEASMLEQVLFNHLLKALKKDSRVVLVGDTNQLPPIGAGNTFNEMIESGVIPVVRLTENFRQKKGSGIAAQALAIKNGKVPESHPGTDFEIFLENSPSGIHATLMRLVATELPARLGIKPDCIQVVTPQRDGTLGADMLNVELQNLLNPDAPQLKRGAKVFRLGDRVMQTSNSSRRNTYNGEVGMISNVDTALQTLEVSFPDGKKSTYTQKDLGELTLAYAITVHKLQGCETDYMVMPLTMGHKSLLYRNMLYTAVSRARQLCVIVAEEKALAKSVENNDALERNSNFRQMLIESLPQNKKTISSKIEEQHHEETPTH